MDALEAFGMIVRRERRRLDYTQERLAELAGLHKNNVGFIERGKNAAALDTIFAISSALGMHPSQLLKQTEALLVAPAKRGRKSA